MKTRVMVGFVGLLIVALAAGDALSRGGRGGGGGGRGGGGGGQSMSGGASRSSPSMSRSPSYNSGGQARGGQSSAGSKQQSSRGQTSKRTSQQPSQGQTSKRTSQQPSQGQTSKRTSQQPNRGQAGNRAGQNPFGQGQASNRAGQQPNRGDQAGNRAGQNPFGQGQAGNRAGNRPQARPSQGDLNKFLNISPGTGAAAAGGATAGAAAGNRQDRAGARQDSRQDQAGSRQDNRQDRAGTRQDRRDSGPNSPQERAEQRHDRGQNVRNEFKDNHPRADFWSDHPHAAVRRANRPYRVATWAALGGWYGGSGGGDGQYYDYGEGGNCYYEDDQVYYEGEPIATTEEYADQAMGFAEAGANTIDEAVAADTEIEWMPLGVFALVGEEKSEPTLYMQLQIAQDGTISGTFANTAKDTSETIQGSVDKESQRVAWTVGDNSNTVIETGLVNLTKDEAPALIHFGKEKTQEWLLVRMDDPEANEGG